MLKELVDTVAHYKTLRHRKRDLKQFYYGVVNTASGLFFICILVGFFIGRVFFDRVPNLFNGSFLSDIKNDLYELGGDLLGSFAQTFRGITQILTSPLTMVRVLYRTWLTRDKNWETFQERKSVVRLVTEATEILASNNQGSIEKISNTLDQLIHKARNRKGQESKCLIPLGRTRPGALLRHSEPIDSSYFITVFHKANGEPMERHQLSEEEIINITTYLEHFKREEKSAEEPELVPRF
jgi:hypothetical protein